MATFVSLPIVASSLLNVGELKTMVVSSKRIYQPSDCHMDVTRYLSTSEGAVTKVLSEACRNLTCEHRTPRTRKEL